MDLSPNTIVIWKYYDLPQIRVLVVGIILSNQGFELDIPTLIAISDCHNNLRKGKQSENTIQSAVNLLSW